MKKQILLVIAILFTSLLSAQKYITKTGNLSFSASVPMFEDINAVDKNNTTVIDTETGAIASVTMVNNFKFSVKLMEEHFNENYAESAKYPKTTFKGKIVNFKMSDISATPKKYNIKGTLTFHGVAREVTSLASVYLKDNKMIVKGGFKVLPADYKVTIPKMVMKKIAEEVDVKYNFVLSKQ